MFCKLAEVFNTRIIVRKWGLYYGKNEMENLNVSRGVKAQNGKVR